MSWLKRVGRVASLAALLSVTSLALAQDGFPTIKPTAEHKVLAEEAGAWDAVVKTYMAGPDAEPSISKGTEVNTLLPGGLWLMSEFSGEFGGLKFRWCLRKQIGQIW